MIRFLISVTQVQRKHVYELRQSILTGDNASCSQHIFQWVISHHDDFVSLLCLLHYTSLITIAYCSSGGIVDQCCIRHVKPCVLSSLFIKFIYILSYFSFEEHTDAYFYTWRASFNTFLPYEKKLEYPSWIERARQFLYNCCWNKYRWSITAAWMPGCIILTDQISCLKYSIDKISSLLF